MKDQPKHVSLQKIREAIAQLNELADHVAFVRVLLPELFDEYDKIDRSVLPDLFQIQMAILRNAAQINKQEETPQVSQNTARPYPME